MGGTLNWDRCRIWGMLGGLPGSVGERKPLTDNVSIQLIEEPLTVDIGSLLWFSVVPNTTSNEEPMSFNSMGNSACTSY